MNAPMIASDANNPQFVGAHNPDAALSVKFYTKPVQQPFLSSKENRPIFQDVDYITIYTPGGQLNIVDTPVRGEHKARFPIQWANYQNGKAGDMRETGTPVSAWPFLTASQAEEFKAVKFFTVEQIANASDLQLQTLGMMGGANPHTIRERAKAYLAAAAGTAIPSAQAAELAETKAALATLQKQMSDFMAAQSGLTPIATAPVEVAKRKRRTKAEMQAASAAPDVQPMVQPQPQEEAPQAV